ncbi:MAG: hypothetical protein JAZ02_19260, partial [Candidatus Thiodiazotropha endolucinida]|nr:hypothetical protein [Candidatus Thiodiazotropha endolucinida]
MRDLLLVNQVIFSHHYCLSMPAIATVLMQTIIYLITHKPQPFSRSDKALAEYVKQQRATV